MRFNLSDILPPKGQKNKTKGDLSKEKGPKKKKEENGNKTFCDTLRDTKSRNKWIFLLKYRDAMKCFGKANKALVDFFFPVKLQIPLRHDIRIW